MRLAAQGTRGTEINASVLRLLRLLAARLVEGCRLHRGCSGLHGSNPDAPVAASERTDVFIHECLPIDMDRHRSGLICLIRAIRGYSDPIIRQSSPSLSEPRRRGMELHSIRRSSRKKAQKAQKPGTGFLCASCAFLRQICFESTGPGKMELSLQARCLSQHLYHVRNDTVILPLKKKIMSTASVLLGYVVLYVKDVAATMAFLRRCL